MDGAFELIFTEPEIAKTLTVRPCFPLYTSLCRQGKRRTCCSHERQGLPRILPKRRSAVQVLADEAAIKKWWPNGQGDQHMYTFIVYLAREASSGGTPSSRSLTIIDQKKIRVGVRDIKLVREPLRRSEGETFEFGVNGIPMFMKGAQSPVELHALWDSVCALSCLGINNRHQTGNSRNAT